MGICIVLVVSGVASALAMVGPFRRWREDLALDREVRRELERRRREDEDEPGATYETSADTQRDREDHTS